jgi:triosephosphate isomerase
MLIAGNWKMFKGANEARLFAAEMRRLPERAAGVDVVLCPSFTSLRAAVEGLGEGSAIRVFAQNVHWEREGAFTGEVAPSMLLELGVRGALVGHSERRRYFGETDDTAQRRAEAALEAGLDVIVCVGETEAERAEGATERVLARQVSVLPRAGRLTIAYEPVWAIGTGRTATPEIAQEAHAFIRSLHPAPVLYGGSVTAENAAALLAQPDVEGALVGGASLETGSFESICLAASGVVADRNG